METTSVFVMLASILIAVLIAFFLVPFLKRKGVLNEKSIGLIQKFLLFLKLLLQNFKGNKATTNVIFAVAEKVVSYVEQTMKTEDNEIKKNAAIDNVIEVLGSLGIKLSDENVKLIEIGIESAVNLLPKTNK